MSILWALIVILQELGNNFPLQTHKAGVKLNISYMIQKGQPAMSYTNNPHIGKTRRLAVNDVLVRKLTKAFVARRYGVHRATIGKWLERATSDRKTHIETRSSKPHRHPNQVSNEIEQTVIKLRFRIKRCAPILHAMLKGSGTTISLSSVERILRRNKLTRKTKQLKLPYAKIQRPIPDKPGDLVEMDTIHFVKPNGIKFYIYAVIDVCSRYGYAEYSRYLSAQKSGSVARNALRMFGFRISTIQTDNGGEFGEHFYFSLKKLHIKLRHIRIGKPNDNAHIERFVRTIQEEGFNSMQPNEKTIQIHLKDYITYYNYERLHLGINCNTPCSIVAKLLN